jgi:hypothetical protein
MKKDAVILIALLIALIVGSIFVAKPQKSKESKVSTTYNADPMGTKAFYILLQRMGYHADRLDRPHTEMPGNAKILIVVQPSTAAEDNRFTQNILGPGISDEESKALDNWVNCGGTVIFLADELDGVPAAFGSTHKSGKGFVYAFPSRKTITNKCMRNPKNALKLLRIIDKHASKSDLIVFDEYHHGIIHSRPLLSYVSSQVWTAIVIVFIALILLVYSRGRRFGAVRSLPSSETVRPGYEFVESVARLYQRAHASDLAAGVLCESFRQGLCVKLGLSSDTETNTISLRLSEEVTAELAERASRVLTQCDRAILAGEKPTQEELVDIAREVFNLEKELGIGT